MSGVRVREYRMIAKEVGNQVRVGERSGRHLKPHRDFSFYSKRDAHPSLKDH